MSHTPHPKTAQTDHDVHELIRQRWSPRAFDSDRPVARAALLQLLEAARWASSSANEQPWRFVVAARDREPDAFARCHACLTTANAEWAARAPVLALVAVRRTFEKNDASNHHAWYDAGQAVSNLTLQATAVGLSVRQMAGFDPVRAREACEVPDPFEPAVMLAIGYAGDPESLAREAHRNAERAPRRRRSIGEFVFAGRWGVRWEER